MRPVVCAFSACMFSAALGQHRLDVAPLLSPMAAQSDVPLSWAILASRIGGAFSEAVLCGQHSLAGVGRRQIPPVSLLLRSGPQGGTCGCGHLLPGVVEPTRVQAKASLLS